jgi:hypothetical protein
MAVVVFTSIPGQDDAGSQLICWYSSRIETHNSWGVGAINWPPMPHLLIATAGLAAVAAGREVLSMGLAPEYP